MRDENRIIESVELSWLGAFVLRRSVALVPVLFACSVLWAQAPTLVVTGTGSTTHDFTGSYYGDHGSTPFGINAANPSVPPSDNFTITGSFGSSTTTIHVQGNVIFGHTPFNGCPYGLCTWVYGAGATLNISLQGTAGTKYAIDITKTASMSVATADPIGIYCAGAESTSVNTQSGLAPASFSSVSTVLGTGSISTSVSLGANVGFRQAYCRNSDAEGCLGDPIGYPGGGGGNVDYTLTIVARVNNQPPLSLSCPAATSATMNIPYASAFAAFGGTGTFTAYAINTGSLPPGVTLNSFGGVSGTPTSSGLFPSTGVVTDSSGATATSPACSINVAPGNCVFMVVPPSSIFDASGGTSSVSVTTGSGCGWSASSNDLWITINSGSVGNGNGGVSYTVTQIP